MNNQKTLFETELYKGKRVEVRKIKKGSGGETYALCRPWSKYQALETIDDFNQANKVARYIDTHDEGVFNESTRAKAHRYAGI